MAADFGIVAYDLAPPSDRCLLVPVYRPLINAFTPEGQAELARRRAEDEAARARNFERLTAARLEWEAARERLAGNAPALAVLGIHRPYLSWAGEVACTHCREDGCDEAVPVPWACATYRAVTGEG